MLVLITLDAFLSIFLDVFVFEDDFFVCLFEVDEVVCCFVLSPAFQLVEGDVFQLIV